MIGWLVRYRRYYIQRLINIYESEINTGGIPHLYSIGVFTILDFLHIFTMLMLFNWKLDKISAYLLTTILLGINYFIYKYVKVDVDYKPVNKYLIYIYLYLALICLLIILLFGFLL